MKSFSYGQLPYWGLRTSSQNGQLSDALIIELDQETELPVTGAFETDETTLNNIAARIIFFPEHDQLSLVARPDDQIHGMSPYLKDYERRPVSVKNLFESPILAHPISTDDPLLILHSDFFKEDAPLSPEARVALCKRIATTLGTQPVIKSKPQ